MKVKCTNADAAHLELNRVYTVASESDDRYRINVFEGEDEYMPMYGSYEKRHFQIVEE